MKKLIVIMLIGLLSLLVACNRKDEESIDFVLNPGIDTVALYAQHTDAGATASVNDQALTVSVVSNSVDTNTAGVYEIVYQATHNQQTYQIRRIVHVVRDAMTLELNPGVDTVKVNTAWQDAGITALDADGNQLPYTTEGSVDVTTPGIYEIVYSVRDADGDLFTITRIVHVIE